MKKTYISKTGAKITFPVRLITGKVEFVSLNGVKGDFTTDKVTLQNAIESSRKFKQGEVQLLYGKPNEVATVEDAPKEEVEVHPKEEKVIEQKPEPPVVIDPPKDEDEKPQEVKSNVYPGVKDVQTAASILKKNYSVSHQSVRLPAQILKKAKELNVSFPDLVQE